MHTYYNKKRPGGIVNIILGRWHGEMFWQGISRIQALASSFGKLKIWVFRWFLTSYNSNQRRMDAAVYCFQAGDIDSYRNNDFEPILAQTSTVKHLFIGWYPLILQKSRKIFGK